MLLMYKKVKNIIPDAYKSIYKGWPWAKNEANPKNVSFSETPKLENVTGSKSNADANIAGITPAELIFNGKNDDSPPYILLPICLLG